MNSASSNPLVIVLEEAVDGHLIPTAVPVTIPQGSTVTVCQQLGGSATVYLNGNLIRIGADQLATLGLSSNIPDCDKDVSETAVWEVLKTCYDPEIPVNIVDLGLIYACELKHIGTKTAIVVVMTLTAPGCGMGPVLIEEIKSKLLQFEAVHQVDVELVFEPPWTAERMSDAAKLELGMF